MLAFVALVYAFLANLRTVSDQDIFWQLATGRWIAQHHYVFSTEVFSYTAQGQPWIYPAGSGLFFYAAYLIGGYGLISLIGAVACAGTVALLLRRGSVTSAAITIIAVPVIVGGATPRAEMFTLVLFAAYLSILWERYQTGRARLWLLPLLMIAWVNLHLGFVAGLALMVAFIGIDLLETLFPGSRRMEAVHRLKRAAPWFAATGVATLANPWGWGIYSALIRQNRAMALHSGWIAEWGSIPLNWTAAAAVFSPTTTKGSFYLLLLIAIIAILIALLQRQLGAAILLIAAVYLGMEHVRMYALTACIVVLIGGSVLSSFWAVQQAGSRMVNARVRFAVTAAIVCAFAILAGVRCFDDIRNYQYRSPSAFGMGLSWWVPAGAAEFIQRENLPGEIFNTYNEGGYLVWKLGPERRDYIDGRAIPFGPEIFHHEAVLLTSSLDSEVWQREAEQHNINTILLPLGRYDGALEAIKTFCGSTSWRPVYFDELGAVFVRRKPETEELIKRWQVDCSTAPLVGEISPSHGGAFNQWANAASIMAALGRNSEALAAADRAAQVDPGSSFVPWLRGNVYSAMDLRSEAEREYLQAISLDPHESLLWFSIAKLYKQDGRISDAIYAQRRAIDLATVPEASQLLELARLYLGDQQPKAAVAALDKAVHEAPPDLLGVSGTNGFRYQVAMTRANAWRALGDTKRAASFEEEAVRDLVPVR